MIDTILLLLVVLAIYLGTKNHNPKHVPYLVSLVVGILLATGLHTRLAKYINGQSQLDYAFSSVASFAILVLVGAILFYASLLLYFYSNEEQATKVYSSFSKLNYISFPILVVALFCISATIFSELPARRHVLTSFQEKIARARSIKAFRSLVQKSGIDSEVVMALKNVPLSSGETSENVTPLSFKSITITYDQKQEFNMTKLINVERAKYGIESLEYTNKLADVARKHSIDMLKRRYFAHINLDGSTPFERLHQAKIGYTIAGENLAISTSLESAVSALMQSPTHRANILNKKFQKTGIGIAVNQDGIMAISQEFTD